MIEMTKEQLMACNSTLTTVMRAQFVFPPFRHEMKMSEHWHEHLFVENAKWLNDLNIQWGFGLRISPFPYKENRKNATVEYIEKTIDIDSDAIYACVVVGG